MVSIWKRHSVVIGIIIPAAKKLIKATMPLINLIWDIQEMIVYILCTIYLRIEYHNSASIN